MNEPGEQDEQERRRVLVRVLLELLHAREISIVDAYAASLGLFIECCGRLIAEGVAAGDVDSSRVKAWIRHHLEHIRMAVDAWQPGVPSVQSSSIPVPGSPGSSGKVH